MTAYEKLTKCYECVKSKIDFEPKVALVLGSGLGDYANSIDVKYTLSYKDIEGFPTSTVEGHKGQFVFGYVGKVPVVIMQGRVHYYEGYAMEDVVLPARLMRMLGAKVLFPYKRIRRSERRLQGRRLHAYNRPYLKLCS